MFKNALVSVSDKTGLVEFLKPLAAQGLRIVSTGGTAKHLKENGLQVVDVSEQTQFPEVMGGRVKTLHPLIHMALLARTGHAEDEKLLKQYGLEPFDLVICNLYPFEESLLKSLPEEEMIENIDIGGPTVLRASAKCFDRIAVICHPQDYAWISQKSELNSTDRKKLAAKVFSHVSSYDSLVSAYLDPEWGERFSLAGHKVMSLRYGENPQQAASWYRRMGCDSGLHSAEILQGKVLSYNNLLDLDAAVGLVQALEHPSAVAVKHNNPCGVATADSLAEAVVKALKSDPISVFGGIIAVNRKITQVEAEALQGIFLECLIAPDYEPQALEIFSRKKNFRVLKWPDLMSLNSDFDLKTVQGGFLIQKKDVLSASTETWKIKGEKPNADVLRDLIFSEKVCASLKSNAIALVGQGQTLGLGMGQVNRVDAVKHAIDRMRTHFPERQNIVMASDAFFPFADSIEVAAQAGVRWILQPGGSVKDDEVFAAAERLKINMILTGQRHFKH